jgi:hypothetical protein
MPPLPNPRWERFTRALFEGATADEAHTKAGYSKNRGNASRLKANESVSTRLAELQQEAAVSSQVTVESLLRELEHARKRADSLDQLAASVKAIEAKAKVSGLLVQRLEVTDTTPEPPSNGTVEDIAAWFAWNYEGHRVELDDEQRREFGRVLRDAFAEIEKFLAPFNAKPVPTLPALPARSPEDIERKRLGLLPRGNGR